jgi:hypothetical protein
MMNKSFYNTLKDFDDPHISKYLHASASINIEVEHNVKKYNKRIHLSGS